MGKGFTHESVVNESQEWYTPVEIFDALGIEFDLDPCSPGPKIVSWLPAKKHLTIEDNGLLAKWEGNVWLNPPYGKETPVWLNRLALHGKGIALVFARTDTKWFHDIAKKADALCFVKGRIKFVPADDALEYIWDNYEPTKGSPGSASVLIAFGKDNVQALVKSGLGLTITRDAGGEPATKNPILM